MACGPVSADLNLVGQRAQRIIGGAPYTGHPAVGLIELSSGGQCTGTLVGLKTVLTAAHCFKAPAYSFLLDGGETISGATWHKHPDFKGDNTPYDIGIITLARQPKDVVPLPVSTAPPSVGKKITLVGYGVTYCELAPDKQSVTCTDDGGIKRRTENTIANVDGIEFTFDGEGNTCKGDSGGPAFATIEGREVCVGVTSRGKMPCGTEGIDTRVDRFVQWLSEVAQGDLNTGAPPEVMLTEPADGATLPGGALKIKARAHDDSGYVKQVVLWVDGAEVQKLDGKADDLPYTFSVDLPPGPHELKVVATDHDGIAGEAAAKVTVEASGPSAPKPAAGTFGAECERPDECQSGMCAADANLGRSYCTEPCDPSGEACPGSGRCTPTADADQHVCALILDAPPADDATRALIGGCHVGTGRGTGPVAALILLVLWRFTARRRR